MITSEQNENDMSSDCSHNKVIQNLDPTEQRAFSLLVDLSQCSISDPLEMHTALDRIPFNSEDVTIVALRLHGLSRLVGVSLQGCEYGRENQGEVVPSSDHTEAVLNEEYRVRKELFQNRVNEEFTAIATSRIDTDRAHYAYDEYRARSAIQAVAKTQLEQTTSELLEQEQELDSAINTLTNLKQAIR